jgi:ABC-2 type transport system permease protein
MVESIRKADAPRRLSAGSVLFSARIYMLYFVQFLKARLSYKADFAASIAASILSSLTGLAFVYLLIDGATIEDLAGWSRGEVMFIYGFSYLPTALFSMVSLNLYGFGDRYIIQGQFDRILLRPLNSLFQVIFESFNLESVGNLLVGIVIILAAKHELGLSFGIWDYLWIVVATLSGSVILLSVFIVVSSLSFHFEDRLGISAPIFNLLNFGRYPVNVFSRVIQVLLSVIIPFAFIAFYPSTHFFKRSEFEFLSYLSPLVAVIAAGVAAFMWRLGVERYSSTGS